MNQLAMSRSPERSKQTRLLLLSLFAIAVIGIAAACGGSGATTSGEPPGDSTSAVTLAPISESDAVAVAGQVIAYMSDKAWGFFGATCDQWIEIDYELSHDRSGISSNGTTVVVYNRRSDREIGPLTLTFRIDPTGSITGENKLERSGIAEGCDKW